MAELVFTDAALTGIVTTVGDRRIAFAEEREALGVSAEDGERLQRTVGLSTRHVVSGGQTTTDLCLQSARELLAGLELGPADVDGLILVTQTPDYAAPSSAISLAGRLGLSVHVMAFDMRLGCSGFVYGLATASSLVQSGLRRVIVCVGDVASRMVPAADHTITPLMGDAGAAAMVERKPARSLYQLYSDGSGERALFIPNSGLRRPAEDAEKPARMVMDGAAVFNFTLKRVPGLVNDILAAAAWSSGDVDYFVLHQPNKYILKNLQSRLELEDERLPTATQSVYGNQNSASIPGTISGFLSQPFSERPLKAVFAGFGIGLSWAACALETEPMFAPPTRLYEEPQT